MAFGDRKDGKLVRDIDGMHFICPIIYPNRCDNEAFIYEKIDLTNVNKYLKKKNKDNPEYKYNLFQVIITTMSKVLYLRPQMNYFIQNSNLYERNDKSISFVVKKKMDEKSGEGLAFVHLKEDYNIDTIHNEIKDIIYSQRSGGSDGSSDSMDMFLKMPRFIGKFLVHIIMFLDRHGWVPNFLIESDPYYSSVVLTNLGSIKMHAGYHHLTNWGTNSIFLAIGEEKLRAFFDESGKATMKDSVDIGFTIDERIANGFYYSKTIELFKYILENPELLEEPLNKEITICQESKQTKSKKKTTTKKK